MKSMAIGISQSDRQLIIDTWKCKQTLRAMVAFLKAIGAPSHEAVRLLSPLGTVKDNFRRQRYRKRLYDDRFFAICCPEATVDVYFGWKRAIVCVFTDSNRLAHVRKLAAQHFALPPK